MKLSVLLFLFVFLNMGSFFAYANSEKLLDGFSSTTHFYTSVFSGSGTVNASVDLVNYMQGNSSLLVSYTLSAGGSSLEVYRSYGSNTLDLSFSPDKLSLNIKGQGATSQVFKFMLYEDQNMNGNPFEAGDEIYEFVSTTVLNGSTWQTLDMPYTSFTKFGGGAGTLDLNRIGAWRIVVINNQGTSVSSSFYVDQLIQHTSYSKPVSGTSHLKGSFIQLWNSVACSCGQYTQAQWEAEFQKMKDVCLESVVVQYGFYDNNAWYQPSSLAYATYANPTLNRMFAAAEAKNIKLYLGLYFDETWNASDKSLSSSYSSILTKHQEVADELWSLFGTSPAFEGWYIPQEINDLEWQNTATRNLLANWLRDVSSYLKAKSTTKKVLIAPFFGPNRPADDLESWWNAVLTIATDIDVIAPQDGVGTTSKVVDVDVPLYFEAIKNACDARGIEFAATVESFRQTDGWPINGNSFAAVPTSIDMLKSQVWEASRFTDQLWQFEWGYMQPELSGSTTALYNAYTSYAETYCSVTSLDRHTFPDDVLLYPTFCKPGDRLTLKGLYTIEQVHLTHTGQGNALNLNHRELYIEVPEGIAAGLYVLTVCSGDQVKRFRMVVINE